MEVSFHQTYKSSFLQLLKRSIEDDFGRERIIKVVNAKSVVKFASLLPSNGIVQHIGHGSYAEVFRLSSRNHVLKVIRLLPDSILDRLTASRSGRVSKYIDAYSELQISIALSKLNSRYFHNGNVSICPLFPTVIRSYLTDDGIPVKLRHGIPDRFVDIFDDYHLALPREHLVIEMEDCGHLLSQMIDHLPPYTLLSVFKQILIGLMIAEDLLEFEHRDLHFGNILLQWHTDKSIQFTYNNTRIDVPCYGYRVKIIDTTFSRLKYQNIVYYRDLTALFANFTPRKQHKKTKMQDIIYQRMAAVIGKNWNNFYPQTNMLWIKFITYRLIKSLETVHIDQSKIDEKQQVMKVLRQYYRLVDKCSTTSGLVSFITLHSTLLNSCVSIQVHA